MRYTAWWQRLRCHKAYTTKWFTGVEHRLTKMKISLVIVKQGYEKVQERVRAVSVMRREFTGKQKN